MAEWSDTPEVRIISTVLSTFGVKGNAIGKTIAAASGSVGDDFEVRKVANVGPWVHRPRGQQHLGGAPEETEVYVTLMEDNPPTLIRNNTTVLQSRFDCSNNLWLLTKSMKNRNSGILAVGLTSHSHRCSKEEATQA